MRVTSPGPVRPRGRWLFVAGLALYEVLFAVFYPPTFAIVDEDAYLTQALLFRSGRLTYENSGIPAPHMTVEHGGRLASKYPPGNSLLLVPFTLFGWRGVFACGLVLSLLGTWLFLLALRRIVPGADESWALLYLFYPVSVLFSRTVMSDLPAATAVLAAFVLLVRRRHLPAGLLLGLACLVRYSTAVLVPVFGVLVVFGAARRWKSLGLFALGLVPAGMLAAGWNWHCYGGPLGFPMYLTGNFHPGYFLRNVAFYLPALFVLYPLMPVAPVLAGRKWRRHLVLPGLAVLLLYCFASYLPGHLGFPARELVGLRYLLPGIVFFVLGYAVVLARFEAGHRWFRFARLAGLVLLAGLAAAVHLRHDRLLEEQARYRDLVYEKVPPGALLVCDAEVSELVSFAWGRRDWIHFVEFGVPTPVDGRIAGRDTVYAAMMSPPGAEDDSERAMFLSLLARHRERRIVLREEGPRRLEIYRLKPAGRAPVRAGG